MSLYINKSTATNVVKWCLACVNIKAHTCCAFVRQLAKTGDQQLGPLQPAKPKADHKATINRWLLIQPGARDPPVLSHTDMQVAVHTYVETFAHSYAPVILQISGWGYYKGEIKRREGGHAWAPAWQRHHSSSSLSYAGAICHPSEHLQTQGALVTQC